MGDVVVRAGLRDHGVQAVTCVGLDQADAAVLLAPGLQSVIEPADHGEVLSAALHVSACAAIATST